MTNELTPTLPPLALALTPYSPDEPFKQKQTDLLSKKADTLTARPRAIDVFTGPIIII